MFVRESCNSAVYSSWLVMLYQMKTLLFFERKKKHLQQQVGGEEQTQNIFNSVFRCCLRCTKERKKKCGSPWHSTVASRRWGRREEFDFQKEKQIKRRLEAVSEKDRKWHCTSFFLVFPLYVCVFVFGFEGCYHAVGRSEPFDFHQVYKRLYIYIAIDTSYYDDIGFLCFAVWLNVVEFMYSFLLLCSSFFFLCAGWQLSREKKKRAVRSDRGGYRLFPSYLPAVPTGLSNRFVV